jgi:protein TonB
MYHRWDKPQEVAMLAYATHSAHRRDGARPKLLVPIVAGHLALIAIVMTARMEVPASVLPPPLVVDSYRASPPPPPDPEPTKPHVKIPPAAAQTTVTPVVDIAPVPRFTDLLPSRPLGNVEDGTGTAPIAQPYIVPNPPHQIIRTGPRLATAENMLRPPYPTAKREAGEEAALTLKLTIDEHGRVIAIEPVGKADPAFLASARAHLLRAWRFEPATEDGKPVASIKTITLRFELGEG